MNLATSLWLNFSTFIFSTSIHAVHQNHAQFRPGISIKNFISLDFPITHLKQTLNGVEISPSFFSLPFKIYNKKFFANISWNLVDGIGFSLDSFLRPKIRRKFTLQKSFCCRKFCAKLDEEIRIKKEEDAELQQIRAERRALIAQPDITLEMLVQSLEQGGFLEEGLSSELIQKRKEAVHWIITEMKKSGSLDGTAATFRDTLEHDIHQFVANPENRDVKLENFVPYSDRYTLERMAADKKYWNQSQDLKIIYNSEFRWDINFFEGEDSPIKQKFLQLADQFNNACQEYINLIQQKMGEETVQFQQGQRQLFQAAMELEGFYLGLNLVLENIEVRIKRLYARIFERSSEVLKYADFIDPLYHEMSRAAAQSQITEDYRRRNIVEGEKPREFNRECYAQIWNQTQQLCQKTQESGQA